MEDSRFSTSNYKWKNNRHNRGGIKNVFRYRNNKFSTSVSNLNYKYPAEDSQKDEDTENTENLLESSKQPPQIITLLRRNSKPTENNNKETLSTSQQKQFNINKCVDKRENVGLTESKLKGPSCSVGGFIKSSHIHFNKSSNGLDKEKSLKLSTNKIVNAQSSRTSIPACGKSATDTITTTKRSNTSTTAVQKKAKNIHATVAKPSEELELDCTNNNQQDEGESEFTSTKVCVRLLPPTLSKEEFVHQVGFPLAPHNYFHLSNGDAEAAHFYSSTVWINFISAIDAFQFINWVRGLGFLDSNTGKMYYCQPEYSFLQQIPKKMQRKNRKRGTLEQTPHYQAFLKKLEGEAVKFVGPTPEEMALEVSRKQMDSEKTAPLVEYIISNP